MPGEYPGEVGRHYVLRVCNFLHQNYGFNVWTNSYDAPNSVSVLVGDEHVRFDIILNQTFVENPQIRETKRKFFFCECKWRTGEANIKTDLQDFLKKALKTMPKLEKDYAENFGFIFFCNRVFGVDQQDLTRIESLKELLNDDAQINDLASLSRKISLVILSDWLLDTTSKGVA
jgi:hypothetical protein